MVDRKVFMTGVTSFSLLPRFPAGVRYTAIEVGCEGAKGDRALPDGKVVVATACKTVIAVCLVVGLSLFARESAAIPIGCPDFVRAKVPGTTGRVSVVRLVGMGVARGYD